MSFIFIHLFSFTPGIHSFATFLLVLFFLLFRFVPFNLFYFFSPFPPLFADVHRSGLRPPIISCCPLTSIIMTSQLVTWWPTTTTPPPSAHTTAVCPPSPPPALRMSICGAVFWPPPHLPGRKPSDRRFRGRRKSFLPPVSPQWPSFRPPGPAYPTHRQKKSQLLLRRRRKIIRRRERAAAFIWTWWTACRTARNTWIWPRI